MVMFKRVKYVCTFSIRPFFNKYGNVSENYTVFSSKVNMVRKVWSNTFCIIKSDSHKKKK